MSFAVVSLLTDFGSIDPYVGVMKGVILRRAPDVTFVDLTHEIPAQNILVGARQLARAVPHLPVAVHLAVVDPDVGTERAAVAVETERGDVVVGPDNGLLGTAVMVLGGPVAIHELRNPDHRAEVVSNTFHGRDVFAPAAGAIASGVAIADLGPRRRQLVHLELPEASVSDGQLTGEVIGVDRFGNLQLSARAEDAAAAGWERGERLLVSFAADQRIEAEYVTTFGDVADGWPAVLVDSDGHVAVVITGGSAAARTGADVGTPARLSRT